jgi:hypothetical protein
MPQHVRRRRTLTNETQKIRICPSSDHHMRSPLLKLSTVNIAQTAVPCEPPPGQGASRVWKNGTTVNVHIDANFGTTGQDIIAAQIGSWNDSTGLLLCNLVPIAPGKLMVPFFGGYRLIGLAKKLAGIRAAQTVPSLET